MVVVVGGGGDDCMLIDCGGFGSVVIAGDVLVVAHRAMDCATACDTMAAP